MREGNSLYVTQHSRNKRLPKILETKVDLYNAARVANQDFQPVSLKKSICCNSIVFLSLHKWSWWNTLYIFTFAEAEKLIISSLLSPVKPVLFLQLQILMAPCKICLKSFTVIVMSIIQHAHIKKASYKQSRINFHIPQKYQHN